MTGKGVDFVRKNASARAVPAGTLCACGCGGEIPARDERGKPRYLRGEAPYLHGHNPRGKRMEEANRWGGGRIIRRGYVLLYRPDHPEADSKGYVAEHRLVWEEANGRALESFEQVHHINGVRADNRPENLVALTVSQHAQEHGWNPGRNLTPAQRSAAGKKGNEKRWHRHDP